MLNDLIKLNENCLTVKEVIYKGCEMLEVNGFITPTYKDKIKDYLDKFGPYMVIAPNIAFLHGRPKDGVIKTGLSILTLKNGVNFGSEFNDPVKLIFTLCSIDDRDHILLLSNLMKLLISKDDVEILLKEEDFDRFKEVIDKFNL